MLFRLRNGLRFIHQLSQQVEDGGPSDSVAGANRFHRLQTEAAGKHGEPPEQHAFRLQEQIVAPIQSRLEGPLPGQDSPASAG